MISVHQNHVSLFNLVFGSSAQWCFSTTAKCRARGYFQSILSCQRHQRSILSSRYDIALERAPDNLGKEQEIPLSEIVISYNNIDNNDSHGEQLFCSIQCIFEARDVALDDWFRSVLWFSSFLSLYGRSIEWIWVWAENCSILGRWGKNSRFTLVQFWYALDYLGFSF